MPMWLGICKFEQLWDEILCEKFKNNLSPENTKLKGEVLFTEGLNDLYWYFIW